MIEKTEGAIKNGQPMPEKLVTLATQDIGQKNQNKAIYITQKNKTMSNTNPTKYWG